MEAVIKSFSPRRISGVTDYLSIILFFILWEAAPRLGLVEQTFIAPPTVVWLLSGTC